MKTICRIVMPFHIVPGWTFIKLHWSKQANMKSDCIVALMVCGAHDEKYKCKAGRKRHVKITSCRHARIRDNVNFRIGAKPVIDAMVDIGLLHDDSDKYMIDEYKQLVIPRHMEPYTVIEIKEGEDD